ncbi:hypothetical protein ACQP2U_21605 [Nocardia sp. CA-084685]|uniref:hypothetical protein n=1 Tax=Nocardia sp. CA-084685 TaxID=3239970 RepID=UPI003D9A0A39
MVARLLGVSSVLDLADFTIDDAGRPPLEQFRAAPPTPSAQALALAVRVGLATAGVRLA